MKTRIVLLAGAAAAIAAAGPASALVAPSLPTLTTTKAASGGNGSTSGIHDTTKTDRQSCNDSGSRWIEYQGPKDIWPPNHKMRDYRILAHDDDGGNVTLMTVVSSSQPLNGLGDGNTDEDYVDNTPMGADMGTNGEAENTGQVRGERSGKDKAGRTYTFNSHAMWSDGSSCDKTFTAHVPHDQRDQTNTKKNRAARRR